MLSRVWFSARLLPIALAVLALVLSGFAAPTRSGTPAPGPAPNVVMIVFDEFSSTSLLDGRRRIDPVRYPNLAALARDSTWFRNATTVSPWTEKAVPSMLSGSYPSPDNRPVLSDYPLNLFTVLGSRYDFNVREPVTELCPQALCPEGPSEGAEAVVRPAASFDAFLASIKRTNRPTLHFLHVLLPHSPWQYLPSGRAYLQRRDAAAIQRSVQVRWGPDRWHVLQAQQRYLLQVGFVDRLLGRLVGRLRATGLYDGSLLVVTADHGVSFRAGDASRAVTRANASDIAFTPLIVKAPRQRTGRVDDRQLESIDVLPTMLDALGVRVPPGLDGRSALRPAVPNRRPPRLDGRRWPLAGLLRARRQALSRQLAAFGARDRNRLFAIGPRRELIGRGVEQRAARSGTLRAEIDNEALYRFVRRSPSFSPAYVSGRLEGRSARGGRLLAVAVNGRVSAVTRTVAQAGSVQFAALVPETAFRVGSNRVAVFGISAARGRPALAFLGATGRGPTYRLGTRGEVIQSSAGRSIAVRPRTVTGYVDVVTVEAGLVRLAGWAADVSRRRIRNAILVFVNRRFVYAFDAPQRGRRPDLDTDLVNSGFDFRLPAGLLPRGADAPDVRLFGVVDGVASELNYPPAYPW